MQNLSGPHPSAIADALSGGGELGALIRNKDWSVTSLGPIETWPQTLIGALSICLNCRFPIAIYWGKDRILFYNDAWRPIVGNKHPQSLGSAAIEVWPEIWDVILPVFESVDASGEGSFSADQLLPMQRFGYIEECYFDYTFSPIKGSDGKVEGIFNAVLETTFRVLSERRSKVLNDLSQGLSQKTKIDEVINEACRVLNNYPQDIPFSLFMLRKNNFPEIKGMSGITTKHMDLYQSVRSFSGTEPFVGPVPDKVAPIFGAAWPDPVNSIYFVPLTTLSGESEMGGIVFGVNPRRDFNRLHQDFLDRVGDRILSAIRNALAYEAERERSNKLAELDKVKTTFFSNVSHEFRTPLTLMIGPLEELLSRKDNLTPEARDSLDTTYRNSLRLLKLVNTLLDFSRIEAGRMSAKFTKVDLAAFTSDLASTFRSAIENAGLRYTVDLARITGDIYIDRDMWEKIVLNLLSNAFKFTFKGEISVRLVDTPKTVSLVIRDSGVGIAAKEIPNLFQRFHRVDGVVGRSFEGSGIGLALIQELVKLHGGTIGVTSEPGRGTEFIVTLIKGSSHIPNFTLQNAVEETITGRKESFALESKSWVKDETAQPRIVTNRHKILLADDNSDMREYIEKILSPHWEVVPARDGEEAFKFSQEQDFAVVLSDIMMPRLDGFGLIRKLRESAKTRSLPVILLSARAGEESRIEGLTAGADDYLVKPFSAKELLARVKTHLSLNEMRREAEAERKKLRSLFKDAPAIVNVFRGPDHVYDIVHPRAIELVLKGKDPTGLPLREGLPEAVAQGYLPILDGVYQTGKTQFGNEELFIIQQKDGSQKETYWNSIRQAWRDADGKIGGVMEFCVDVTELVTARKARDEFLSLASHEIKTPITGIKLQLQMIQRRIGSVITSENQKIFSYVGSSLKQTDRLVELVEDLLDVSKIQAGKLQFNFEEMSLANAVDEVLEQFRDQLSIARCEVTVDVARYIQPVWDRSRIEQVIANLLSNAIKYAPMSRIHITATEKENQIFFSFKDNGPGISREKQASLFDKFERATSSRNIGGLGLGLYIVKNIIDGHHGTIRLESEPGHGTEFIIVLPVQL